MAEVSKIVRERLAQAPVAGPHPDADLLTAFVERRLITREREQVMRHLATCAGCREIVLLAAPESEPTQETAVVAGKRGWLPLPVLRWGGVAAAVVMFAAVVLMESPRFASPRRQSAAQEQQEAHSKTFASPTPAASPAVPAQAAPPAGVAADREIAKQPEAKPAKQKAAEPPVVASLSGKQAEVASKRDDAIAMDKVEAAPAAPPAVAVAASAPVNTPTKDGKTAGAEVATAQPKPAEEAGMTNENATIMSRAAVPAAAADKAALKKERSNYSYDADSYVGGGGAGALGSTAGRLQAASLRWIVTSDGRVQRSPDGRNWYYVPIAKEVHFRALTNDGPRVWAGGNNAALYYSADAGETWKKQTIERLQGDIIRLVINHDTLSITTSSGQTMDVSSEGWNSSTGPKANSPR